MKYSQHWPNTKIQAGISSIIQRLKICAYFISIQKRDQFAFWFCLMVTMVTGHIFAKVLIRPCPYSLLPKLYLILSDNNLNSISVVGYADCCSAAPQQHYQVNLKLFLNLKYLCRLSPPPIDKLILSISSDLLNWSQPGRKRPQDKWNYISYPPRHLQSSHYL